MGMQDRDYYWEHRAKLDAEQSKRGRAPAKLVLNPNVKPPEPWHPILSILLFVVICLGTFLLLRLFKR